MALEKTTYEQRMARAGAKRNMLLDFLADETWTTQQIVERLLRCTRWTASRTLQAAERDKLVRVEKVGRYTLYGITGAGIAETDKITMPEYEFGHVREHLIEHTLGVQHARVEAEALGWTNWTPARRINSRPDEGDRRKALMKSGVKLPDALVTRPDGRKVAIEIERTVKSRRRYGGVIANHITAILQKRYDLVHYISPDGKAGTLKRIFDSIATVRIDSQVKQLTDAQRSRFRFYDIGDWPPKP
jgi:hypothetical protein